VADNVDITAGSGTPIATDDVSGAHFQKVKIADGAADSNAMIGGDATNGLDVDVTRLPALPAGTNNIGDVDVLTLPGVAGDVAHDTADSGNPVKIGARAIAHGTNPTAVAAADRTDLLANRAGIPFFIGGHPNIQTVRLQFTAAQTNTAVITASAGQKIVVTSFMFTLDNASTVFPTVLLGFATATTPTTSQVIGAHGGMPAGGGFGRGDGSGILGIGADDEDLRLTTTGVATGNGVNLVVTYYTIES
jgi:hypothetical protein